MRSGSASLLSSLSSTQRESAKKILGNCVHCGFCNATCPTYRILGDELDGPRGRIYQIKNVLEGEPVTASFQRHLDRCLTCRNCETTCPSGVEYAQLLDIGRQIAREQGPRPCWRRRLLEWAILTFLPWPNRLKPFLRLAQRISPLLPKPLSQKVPPFEAAIAAKKLPHATSNRKVVIPGGCVQSLTAPNIVDACTRIFTRLGIQVIDSPNQCCGAIAQHLGASSIADKQIAANLLTWEKALNDGAESIITTASGCGVTIKEYPLLFAESKHHDIAQRVGNATLDMCEWLSTSIVKQLFNEECVPLKVAFQSPCTLQHGQKITGKVESLLQAVNCQLLPIKDAYLCCGSAGTYSLLQPKLSNELLANKISALQDTSCDVIVTANIGCYLSLKAKTKTPVKHWIELIDERLKPI